MPSLLRFLTVLAALTGLAFGAVFALATFVSPRTREMTVTIPAARLRPSAEAPVGRQQAERATTSTAAGPAQP